MSVVNSGTKRIGRHQPKIRLENPTAEVVGFRGIGKRERKKRWMTHFSLNKNSCSYPSNWVLNWRQQFFYQKPTGVGIGRWNRGTGVLGKLVVIVTPLIFLLFSCHALNFNIPNSWTTYRNPRYGFEFPYPSNWQPFPMPDNRDGRAFRDPQNPSVEIRGWAANNLSGIQSSSSNTSATQSPKPQSQNFTTDQGMTGQLKVKVGSDISLMTLTLSQDKVLYNWQGQCESQKFADYYRFFNYVASQYRLPILED